MESIKEAKLFLRANFDKGTDCPCCGQKVKRYKRKINSGMVLFLLGVYHLSRENNFEKSYFHTSEIMERMNINTSSLDYSVLKHFGLIIDMPNEKTQTKGSGFWGITTKGIDFVKGDIHVPKHVYLFDNKRIGFSDENVMIRKALGDNFDFNELMRGE